MGLLTSKITMAGKVHQKYNDVYIGNHPLNEYFNNFFNGAESVRVNLYVSEEEKHSKELLKSGAVMNHILKTKEISEQILTFKGKYVLVIFDKPNYFQ